MVKWMSASSAIAAVALAAFFAAPNSSFAAAKKHDLSDKSQCLGGGCTAQNPDRVRDPFQSSYYKKNKKHKEHRLHDK